MNSLNSILLEGNLTADPVLTVTKSDKSVVNFSIASNSYWKDADNNQIKETSFFDVTVWNGLADNCKQYLKKGRGVRVIGRLKQDKWVDDEGVKHAKVVIIAEHVEFKPLFSKSS